VRPLLPAWPAISVAQRDLPLLGSASITSQIKGLLWLDLKEATFKTSSNFRSGHSTMRELKNGEKTCGLRPYHIWDHPQPTEQYLELVSMPVLRRTLHMNSDRTLWNCCTLKEKILHTATAVSNLTKETAFQKWPVTVTLAAGRSLSTSSTLWRRGYVGYVIFSYIFQYVFKDLQWKLLLGVPLLGFSWHFESTNPG
jgi:hypothetical protein